MDTNLEHIFAILNTTPTRWLELTQALPVDMLTRQPAPGEWSPVECLQHMIDVEQLFQSRLRAFLAGRDFDAFDPDREGTKAENASPADLAARFNQLRQASLIALAELQPSDYARTARHAELGMVTLEQMLNEWPTHDLNHTMQAEEAIMQPFLKGCGPWQVYFTNHLIQK